MRFNPSAASMFNQGDNGMQKTRATTLQQKFGFQDPDLTSPAHDAMMVWLDQNVESILLKRYPVSLAQDEIDAYLAKFRFRIEGEIQTAQADLKWQMDFAREQQAIQDKNQRDREMRGEKPSLFVHDYSRAVNERSDKLMRLQSLYDSWLPGDPPSITTRISRKIWESPVMARNGFLVGFIDMKVVVERNAVGMELGKWRESDFYSDPVKDVYLFEIKPTIQSAGELIRQIRMYQQYQQGIYTVVSPDSRFESVLAGQGIKFLKVTI
jgi:hypothetical protein